MPETLPEAPPEPKRQEPAPRPQETPRREPAPKPSPFDPNWPDSRPLPQPKARSIVNTLPNPDGEFDD